jgi:phospholipase C
MPQPIVTPKRVYSNPTDPILQGIEHVVVLMFENRSFDNMLGGLYPEQSKTGVYNGLKGDELNNLDPSRPEIGYAQVWSGDDGSNSLTMPYPDPGELFSDMNEQIFAADSDLGKANMGGFVWNYQKQPPSPDQACPIAQNIMHYYQTGSHGIIPVTSALAQNYAVSDLWFASGPVQTLANRIFAHCATPGTYLQQDKVYAVLNNTDISGYPDILGAIKESPVFELLDGKNLSWKVYYDDFPLSVAIKYVYDHWHWFTSGGNVYQFNNGKQGDFFSDVESGLLPTYAFIEPCYTDTFRGIPNSNHPGGSDWNENPPPISLCYGEQLLHSVYAALCNARDVFEKTLLIVTYDEHGGLYDHMPPPPAASPFSVGQVANFDYSRYGVRVPILFINPYIQPGTIFCPPQGCYFDHTTIVSTLLKKYGLGSLTARDASAPTLASLIDKGNSPRTLDPTSIQLPMCLEPAQVQGSPQRLRSAPRQGSIAMVIKRALQNPKIRERVLHQKGIIP